MIRKLSLLLLVGSVTLAACADLPDSARLLAPEEVQLNRGAPAGEAASPAWGRYRLLTRGDITASGSAGDWIGPTGGTLTLGDYTLEVPAFAVNPPGAYYTMSYATDATIGVKLTASSRYGSTSNDVGSRGFSRPVTLTLSYASAVEEIPNPATLVVARVIGEDSLVPMPSRVDRIEQTVTGTLGTFSDYGIAWPM